MIIYSPLQQQSLLLWVLFFRGGMPVRWRRQVHLPQKDVCWSEWGYQSYSPGSRFSHNCVFLLLEHESDHVGARMNALSITIVQINFECGKEWTGAANSQTSDNKGINTPKPWQMDAASVQRESSRIVLLNSNHEWLYDWHILSSCD